MIRDNYPDYYSIERYPAAETDTDFYVGYGQWQSIVENCWSYLTQTNGG